MEKELRAKDGMKEVIATYGPREADRKIFEIVGKEHAEVLGAFKKKVNPQNTELKVASLASGSDVVYPLAATGATTLVLIDMLPWVSYIRKDIETMGGKIEKKPITSGNRTEIDFEWDGKDRRLIFYHLKIDNKNIDKLPAEMKDCDVLFEKRAGGIRDFGAREKIINSIKLGGFHISDAGIDRILGFERIPLDEKFERKEYGVGAGHLQLHRKVREVPAIKEILCYEDLLFNAGMVRNGSLHGIKEENFERSFVAYRKLLTDMKEVFNAIPAEMRAELKGRAIEKLVNAPGDIFIVKDSPENLREQYDARVAFTSEKLSQKERDDYETKIQKAESSPDKPTQKQLEKFVEEGKKIFHEILGEFF